MGKKESKCRFSLQVGENEMHLRNKIVRKKKRKQS